MPIPIGITGFVSKKLWEKVNKDFSQYYPENSDFIDTLKEINNADVSSDDLISNILKAISLLQKV
ncbi:hypothetical protein FOB20_16595 [Acinetobacter lwoffii]|uniref:hypothetical protein n=1 Tax=Acinetobacter lwoffii TaxID=28090 RepID=UPI00142EFDDB|nr:hypothetical protein FOB20_16595 [Acinetobacter lwoffii]